MYKKHNLDAIGIFCEVFLAPQPQFLTQLSFSQNIFHPCLETGWPITAHSVGLGDVAVEHLQTTGRPVPGYNGIS